MGDCNPEVTTTGSVIYKLGIISIVHVPVQLNYMKSEPVNIQNHSQYPSTENVVYVD